MEFDRFLQEAQDMLSKRVDLELSVEQIDEELEEMEKPDFDFSLVADLTQLCLFNEDLLHKRRDAYEKSATVSILSPMEEKITKYITEIDFLEQASDQILFTQECMNKHPDGAQNYATESMKPGISACACVQYIDDTINELEKIIADHTQPPVLGEYEHENL